MPEPKQHMRNRGALETVLRKIPGFRGYLEKEYRRESDQLHRGWLADRLTRAKRALDEFTRGLADSAQIDALPAFDRLRGRLDKLIGRIQGSMQGYSGFFDLAQVDEALLDRVYQYDVGLMDQVESLAEGIEQLPTGAAGSTPPPADLMRQLEELEQAWDLRSDMLKGVE